jgi:hypothetical protein
MDGVVTETATLLADFTEFRDKYVTDNKLNEVVDPTA